MKVVTRFRLNAYHRKENDVEIVKIIGLLFIGVVLHLATILLSREVDKSEGSNTLVSYLGSIVILGFNILKVFILFGIILQVINLFQQRS